ncbi:Rho termination factor N-terminal domain-containing protein [Mesomycoplasma neurolyticum]|uniref:Rho termination factor, N-terminal domain n=1 Tax=Mesomycoplasma neurolyticum TaxID=2120 RepID=A0A449A5D0_9BACT|nr:Rho termination factor N-terminal domain-containing protein [Mesomycoplasma neurolyticum]VEU59446.1 Rho termination factor, N-terminal domain [Mesomycoplasma neurolyticum]
MIFNNLFNNQKDFETVLKLWEKEPKKFRIWIIMQSIAIALYSIIYITTFILLIVSIAMNKNAPEENRLSNINFTIFFFFPLLVLSLYSHFKNLRLSYIKRNFMYLSGAALSFFSFISVGFLIFQAIVLMVHRDVFFAALSFQNNIVFSWFMVLYIILTIFGISTFFIHQAVRNIKKQFIIADQNEKINQFNELLKTQKPDFENFFENIFSEQKNQPKNQTNDKKNKSPESGINEEREKETLKYQKLNKLTLEQLRKIAKDLEISGYQTLTRDELIKIILKISD